MRKPLLAFNGGQIEVELGLVATKGAADVKTLLKVALGRVLVGAMNVRFRASR